MPRDREPEGQIALANAERQARYRARQWVPRPPVIIKQSRPPRSSRTKRGNDALAEMFAIQAECAAWFEALPESLRDNPTAAALQDMIDLSIWTASPLGYGRD
jgi:hypothetical protein